MHDHLSYYEGNAQATVLPRRLARCPVKLSLDRDWWTSSLSWKCHQGRVCVELGKVLCLQWLFFVYFCICKSLANESRWPNIAEKRMLGWKAPQFQGFIDGTLIKIMRPKIEDHRVFFNGRKKMYSLNNTVIVDHNGLFIHMDLGYIGSYHEPSSSIMSIRGDVWRNIFLTNLHLYFLKNFK